MVVKHIRIIAVFAIPVAFGFLSGCSSQHPLERLRQWFHEPAAPTETAAVPVAPVPSSEKCEIDAKRICQKARKRDGVKKQAGIPETANKQKRKPRARTEPVRTEQIDISHQIPNGSVVQVQCGINSVQNSVVYAHVLPGAVLTDLDVETLKSSGYCVH